MFPDVRACMLNTSGMTLADLHASITLKVQIQLTVPQYVSITRFTFHTPYAGIILYLSLIHI